MSTWPEDADAVIRRIRDELAASADVFDGLDDVRVAADLRGDDLEHLTIDASGAALRLRPQPSATAATGGVTESSPTSEIRSRRSGIARRVRLIAAPVRIDEIPLTIDVELLDVPIDWLEYAEPTDSARPETALGAELRDSGEGMRGTLSASIRSSDVGPLLERVTRAALAAEGLVIRSVRVDLDQDGADGIRLSARVRARWRLLSASARAKVRLRISPDAVVTVHELDVGSRNPLVAFALRAARKTIRAQIGRTFDLNDGSSAAAVRLHQTRVTVGRDVSVSARLG